MDERTLKRLLIILAASILAVVLIKVALIKTYTTLNKVAAEKRPAASVKPTAPQQTAAPPAASEKTGTPAASGEAAPPAYAASSGVGETR